MRKLCTVVGIAVGLAACSFLFLAGCSQQRQGSLEAPQRPLATEPNDLAATPGDEGLPADVDSADQEHALERSVALALKFAPGQTVTYRVTVEAEKSIEWQGDTARKPAAFQAGHTGHHTEVTFQQQVQRVDDQGHATLKITIEALRFLSRALDAVAFDFDSTRPADRDNPLAKLIGQGYSLEMSPKGEVLAVMDIEPARQAVRGNSPEHQTALRLLNESIIKARHEVPALMALPSEAVSPGQRWSDIRSLSFGTMGTKAFERIYTRESPTAVDADRIAVVSMNAIPSSALAQEEHEQQQANPFAQMFDTTEEYDGELRLDLSAGEIDVYLEQLRVQWVAADPAAVETGVSNPAVLRIEAAQLYRLERVK